MRVYVFGNEHVPEDARAIEAARKLENTVEGASFFYVSPNEDVPFVGERHVVILDAVQGIHDVALIEGVDNLVLSPRGSVHDFDLAFQLRYLKNRINDEQFRWVFSSRYVMRDRESAVSLS
jgi:Ni,Fe-hydrogenase maturation factor